MFNVDNRIWNCQRNKGCYEHIVVTVLCLVPLYAYRYLQAGSVCSTLLSRHQTSQPPRGRRRYIQSLSSMAVYLASDQPHSTVCETSIHIPSTWFQGYTRLLLLPSSSRYRLVLSVRSVRSHSLFGKNKTLEDTKEGKIRSGIWSRSLFGQNKTPKKERYYRKTTVILLLYVYEYYSHAFAW